MTKALVVQPEQSDDERLQVLVTTAYNHPCGSLEELAQHSGLPVETIQSVQVSTKVDLVKLSNFKTNFAGSLALNIRNLLVKITKMTQKAGRDENCDSKELKNYTSAMKTLSDMLRAIEGKQDKPTQDGLQRRTIKVSAIIDEWYESEKERQIN